MNNLDVAASWSGGKDSCLAMYKALRAGNNVKFLLNFVSRETKRGCFHGTESRLMLAQSEAIGIPLIQKEVSADMREYEKEFKAAVSGIKEEGINGMVFGDIYLDEHRDWVKRVCSDLNITPLEPLWNQPAEEVLKEFIDAGFKAIVVSAKAGLFEEDFVGKTLDRDVLKDLMNKGICPCGENGEFHTFVVDGPIFKRRIRIEESEPILKEGFWKHWFLDIKKWEVF